MVVGVADPDADKRTYYARKGGLTTSARHDPQEYTAKARRAADSRFLKLVDPDCTLSYEEAERRAEAARKLFYLEFSRRGVEARRRRANTSPAPVLPRGTVGPTKQAA